MFQLHLLPCLIFSIRYSIRSQPSVREIPPFFQTKIQQGLKKEPGFFHGTFHHLHKKKWWMVQCCLQKGLTVGLFSFQAQAGAAWGVKGPNLLGFLMWCSLQNTRGFHRNPKNFFRDFGWFPQIQLRLGPWVVKQFLLGGLPLGGWVYPIPEVETPNFQGILIIICQKTINHELSSVKHLQLRMISQLQKFWSSFYWFLAWISATYPWNPNQTKSHQASRTPSQHPRLRPSTMGWEENFFDPSTSARLRPIWHDYIWMFPKMVGNIPPKSSIKK